MSMFTLQQALAWLPGGTLAGDGVVAIARVHSDTRVIVDRHEALASAGSEADPCDVVLVAGKGHEDYQEIAGVRHPFSDAAEARAALDLRSCP